PSVGKIFGKNQCYIRQRPLHKLVFPSTRNIGLWHCAHQSSDYFPPAKAVKKVLTMHDLNYLHDESKTAEKKRVFLDDVQRKIDAADHIAFISHFSQNDAQTHLDLEGKSTSVIYNGCTIQELPELKPPPFVPDRPFLFTLGTITDKKNFHVLPRLLPGNDFLLVIAGVTQSKAYKEKIEEEAKQLGVLNRVVFTGPVWENDKQWYLKHCTAFVFPSLAEGFGLPVLEAMYFEKPVLLSLTTSLPEIGGPLAGYFSGFEEAQMQKTLTDILHQFELDPQRKAALKRRAISFSWDEAAIRYHAIYRQLVGKSES
ncbi:MAG TPA: glycosyltransferase family 1 protein, partial [Flavisolibacter sp.]|nr:glycosyltransferase family 1 protein [Flavisolibacter sp.]